MWWKLCQDLWVPSLQVTPRPLEVLARILRFSAGLPFSSILVTKSIHYLWKISLLCCRNGILCNIVSENKPKRIKAKKRTSRWEREWKLPVIQVELSSSHHIICLGLQFFPNFHQIGEFNSNNIAFKYLIITKGTTHRIRNEAKLTLPDIIWTLVNFNFSWKLFSNLSSLFFDFFSKKVKIENKQLGVCSLLGLPWIVGLHYFNPLLFCLKYETRNKIVTNQQFQIRPVRVWIMDCSRKIHTPRLMGFWKFSWEGGSKTLEIQAGGGWGVTWKSLLQGSFRPIVHVIQTFSSVTLQCSQTLKIVEIFCSLMYFSPDKNNNLSSFAGPFIAENMNNKILNSKPSQHCCNKEFETPEFPFLLVPRPSTSLLCNFTLAPYDLNRKGMTVELFYHILF